MNMNLLVWLNFLGTWDLTLGKGHRGGDKLAARVALRSLEEMMTNAE